KIRIDTAYSSGNSPRTRGTYTGSTKALIGQGSTARNYAPSGPYPGYDRQVSTAILNEVREMITGIREAGPSFDICVECHGKWNVASAGRILKMLEPFDPFFVEETVPPENVDARAALQASKNMPIATEESRETDLQYKPLR